MAGRPTDVLCMATVTSACDFKPTRLQRRPVGLTDVLISMKYCGVCHTDLHAAAGHVDMIMPKTYPFVPGHELAGVVTAVGARVTKVRPGDSVGVGCMVDSCGTCAACKRGEEQKCAKQVGTYGGKDNGSGRAATFPAGGNTLGGYTDKMVVDERFAVKIPQGYPLEAAGPVMCSGVTLYDPLRRYGCGPGMRVGVVGIGGLGQMGVKLAKAMGAHVTAVTRSQAKAAFAREKCGADAVLVSTSADNMAGGRGSIDLLLNTIPVEHDWQGLAALLAPGGTQVLLGLHSGLIAGIVADAVCCGGSRVKSSVIGGIEATQAVIDLCAQHGIVPEVRVVPVEGINGVYEALDKANESGERYVIDIAGSLNEGAFARCKDVPPPRLTPGYQGLSASTVLGAILATLCCCRWRGR